MKIEDDLSIEDQIIRECKISNFNTDTAKKYIKFLGDFINYSGGVIQNDIKNEDLKKYIYELTQEEKANVNSINSRISALNFCFCKVLNKKYLKLNLLKKDQYLRDIPGNQKVNDFILNADLRLKTFLILIKRCGLRASEALNIKVTSIDRSKMLLRVVGKGNKTRLVNLDKKALKALETYWKAYKPSDNIFNYSLRYFQKELKKLSEKLEYKLKFHTLRHYYAISFLERGNSLSQLSRQLGHNNTKTTEIYTVLAKDKEIL